MPTMSSLHAAPADAHEALMQFLYCAPVGLVQCSQDGCVEIMNPTAAQLLMPIAPSGTLDNLFLVLSRVAPSLPERVASFAAASGTVCEGLRVTCEAGPAGRSTQKVLSLSVMKLAGERLMAMISDVTLEVQRERQGLNQRLRAASRIDSLTQMPNREVACERVAQAMARRAADPSHDYAVIFINCDRFRQINDAMGHAAGDELLSLMADRLRSLLRQRPRDDSPAREGAGAGAGAGDLAARLGGDEFVVVLDALDSGEQAHAVARRLVHTLSQPFGLRGQQIGCSVSAGLVLSAQAAGDADDMLQDASIAMVEAKRAGGERYCVFKPAMRERAARRSGIEHDLRLALTQDQLFVVYQPVVALHGLGESIDRCAGVEALVRWRHPQRGVVPPVEFIGVAEECGLIAALGEFVLAAACRQFVAWQADLGVHAPRQLAVNLSRGQIGQPDFVDLVARVLAASGMDPARLQLEITESLAAQDESVRACLVALKSLGLTLALDDFGTGYSSLASLHLLPVDTVKIDRSFVSEAVTSEHHRVLIEATVRVARSLGMGTVAEGIETVGQTEVVRSLGCEKGQGYHFSKPLAPADLAEWLVSVDQGLPTQTKAVGDPGSLERVVAR